MADEAGRPTGLVTAAYGRRGVLETGTGESRRYVTKGRRLKAVCGDRVSWSEQEHGNTVLLTDILERTNVLERQAPDRTEAEILAANLTCMGVVFAPAPVPDWYLVDRYLCAAELMGCGVILVGNKNDIKFDQPGDEEEIREYLGLEYAVLSVSAQTGDGIDGLAAAMENQTGVLVGQSGVGKSSLINRLVPDAEITVGNLSAATSEGTHTTTASAMHRLPGGGRLIDTPGVRDFVPFIRDAARVQAGFPEILAVADGCRFSNCQHLREPDCAVKAARDLGRVSARRYEAYKRLRRGTQSS
jgi:ribosome biogenesis GTPase